MSSSPPWRVIEKSAEFFGKPFEEPAYVENRELAGEALTFLTGDMLGSGVYRRVYASPYHHCGGWRQQGCDHDYVIKFALDAEGAAMNLREFDFSRWLTWSEQGHDLKRWIAPCLAISPRNLILTQARTQPIPNGYEFPEKIPMIFADVGRRNWGLYKGRLVCHDYSINHADQLVRKHGLRMVSSAPLKTRSS